MRTFPARRLRFLYLLFPLPTTSCVLPKKIFVFLRNSLLPRRCPRWEGVV